MCTAWKQRIVDENDAVAQWLETEDPLIEDELSTILPRHLIGRLQVGKKKVHHPTEAQVRTTVAGALG